MAALNKVLLIGNLGADPEVKTFSNGDKIASISLATTESYKNKNGERVEDTEWHRVEFRGALAGIVEQYLKKGDSLYVEGRIKTEKYTDSSNIERFITKIRALNMQMLNRKSGGSAEQIPSAIANEDDGLPF
jgi:single-strand DNA-binding protein